MDEQGPSLSKYKKSQFDLEEFQFWATEPAVKFVNEGDTVCLEECPKVQKCDEVLPCMKATKFFEGAMAKACLDDYDPKAAFAKPAESVKGWDVELSNAFDEKDGKVPNSVMLVGPAGSGKTTAIKRFLRDNSGFNIMLCGRKQILKEKVSVRDFIFPDWSESGIPENDLEEGFKWMKANPHKVNFFVDSLDTVSYSGDLSSKSLLKSDDGKLHSPADILSSIMEGSLFKGCKILTTSREHGIIDLHEELQPDRVIALVGLSKESIEKVIHSRLEDGKEFCSAVDRKCPGLWSLMSNPLFLVFTLISHMTVKIGESFQSTMSGILIMILNELSRSYHGKSISKDEVLGKLKKLSYNGIVNGKITFSRGDLNDVGLEPEDTSTIYFHAPTGKGIKVLQGNDSLFFCHQCVQEILAALFVIEMDFEDFKEFVSNTMETPRLSTVQRFIAGILMNEEVLGLAVSLPEWRLQLEEDVKKKQDFFRNALKKELGHRKPKRQLFDMYLTLYEAGGALKEIIYSGIRSVDLSSIGNLSVADMHAIGSVVKYCQVLKKLDMSKCELNSAKMMAFLCGLGDCDRTKVKKFHLTDNWDLGSDGLQALVKMLRIFEDVEKVALDECNLKAEDLRSFALGLREFSIKINKLHIQEGQGCTATPEMVEAVIDLLPQINQTMNLDGWEFSEEDRKKVQQKLKNMNLNCTPPCIEFGWTEKQTIIAGSSACELSVSELNKITEQTKETMSQPVSKAQYAGPEGGKIELMGCQIEFPSHSFERNTPVCVSVKSACEDSEECCRAISPEFRCSTLGAPFTSHATISLPLHIMVYGKARIQHRNSEQADWTDLKINSSILGKAVKFRTSELGWFRAVFDGSEWKIFIRSRFFFKSESSKVYSVTCTAKTPAEEACRKILQDHGYRSTLLFPGDATMGCREEMSYNFEFYARPTSAVVLDETLEISSELLAKEHQYLKPFTLKSPPSSDMTQFDVRYTASKPGMPDTENKMKLEWSGGLVTMQQEPDTAAAVSGVQIPKSKRSLYETHLKDQTIYCIAPDRPKGSVLIINNNDFNGTASERKGSHVDVTNLVALWTCLGFDVVSRNNISAMEMLTSCEKFSEEAANVSAVVVIIMSHGGKNKEGKEYVLGLSVQDRLFLKDVISKFTLKNLRGIPKLFMFQSCRNEWGSDGVDSPEGGADIIKFPRRDDMLIAYATQDGHKSLRDPLHGSVLMSEVTKIFMQYAHEKHVLDMLTMVNNAVAKLVTSSGRLQISNQKNYFMKDLYLFPGWPEELHQHQVS